MKRLLILTLIASLFCPGVIAQDVGANQPCPIQSHALKRYSIFFEFGISKIDHSYHGNADILFKMKEDIEATFKAENILPDSIQINSSSSPDGDAALNRRLAEERALNTKQALLNMIPELANSVIEIDHKEAGWDGLEQILRSNKDFPQAEQMLDIINSDIDEAAKEEALRGCTEGWNHLTTHHLYSLRTSSITMKVVFDGEIDEYVQEVQEAQVQEEVVQPEPESMPEPQPQMTQPQPEIRKTREFPRVHLKTNVIGLGMGVANAAVEIDFAKHWSLAVPVYYSAWDYIKTTVKFRTLAIQPELRFWFSKKNDGFFTGAHMGMGYYNLAFDGNYRYQDHNRETPAIGGGLSLGYRLPISRNDRWKMEFSVGGGMYQLHYDKFHNTPVTQHGLMIETIEQTYLGLDHASISFSYMFDFKKKGGKQ